MQVRVFFTSNFEDDLSGYAAVVIDAFRMTSVAATAVANGCAGLMPVGEISDAVRIARDQDALLGGERGALRIKGFDFSNSPGEYTKEKIAGKRLVITTTNGTRAVAKAFAAKRVLLGAFVNAAAVAAALQGEERVALICAGTGGQFTLEDALAAGCILRRLLDGNGDVKTYVAAPTGAPPGYKKMEKLEPNDTSIDTLPTDASLDYKKTDIPELDDAARASLMLYDAVVPNEARHHCTCFDRAAHLHGVLRRAKHYRHLLMLGLADDLNDCLLEGSAAAVPERGQDGWFA